MNIGFDVISDLNLSPEETFNWENKATSLYCIVAGNISDNLRTIYQTLVHLSRFYQGIFYIPGTLEYKDVEDIAERTAKLSSMCRHVAKTAILYHNVAIIDGVAIIGATGQYNTTTNTDLKTTAELEFLGYEDITYLKNSIEKLQRHVDVKRIIIVTNSVPGIELYFGEEPSFIKNQLPLNLVLGSDTEKKVVSWIYGTYEKIVDTNFNGINYINNSYFKRNPYWAKRVEINF